MTEVAPMFAIRPTPPEIGSDEDQLWRKIRAISYEGGYISAAYGNLCQTFVMSGNDVTCESKNISTTVKGHDRFNTIGGTVKKIEQFSKNYKVFPGKTSSMAAGGEPITIVTDIGEYEARMGGDVQTLISYLCDNKGSMYGPVYVYSGRGKEYGPYGPTTSEAP
jgi:hypothetical protein